MNVFISALMLFSGARFAVAPEAMAALTKAMTPAPIVAPAAAPAIVDDPLCSVQVVQEDLAKVVQTLTQLTKANLVLLSPESVRITLNLANVPLSEMLRHICALSGMSMLKIGTTFVLAQSDRLKDSYPSEWVAAHGAPAVPVPNPVVTRIVQLRFLGARAIAASLVKVLGEDLSAVAIAAPFVPSVAAASVADATGTSGSMLEQPVEQGDVTSRTLLLRGPRDLVEAAVALLAELDVARAQVLIEVTIYDINDTALRELGLNWTFGPVDITETTPRGIDFGSFSRAPQTFQGIIKALEKNDSAKVLASPNISVLDGERAFILIGERINYPVLVGYSQNNAPIFSREEERVGIYLQVAATVNDEGLITLSLYPQVSTITGFLEVNGASYPQISTREAQTTLRVASGETWVLGGLLKTEEISNVEKVPFLGDIPLLGELFKRRKKVKGSSQVIISLKPTVVKPDEPR